jgi:hypothetical protein
MRPPEIDVTYTLEALDCFATEDDGNGDEPYLWILGFKIDADTIGPPAPESPLIPTIGVQIVDGPPFFKHVVGAGHVHGGQTYPIAPLLGSRSFRLRPVRLPVAGWFPGLAGLICLLWDEDGFSPSTSEAGFARFKQALGPVLAGQISSLLSGSYDIELAKTGNGPSVMIDPTLTWRLDRLGDMEGRGNAIKAIVNTVKSELKSVITDAFIDAAGWDELIDPDDLLGAEAQVNLGNELLAAMLPFEMTFTDDEANYQTRGRAVGKPIHRFGLSEAQSSQNNRLDKIFWVEQSVCRAPVKLYLAISYREDRLAIFSINTLSGPPPREVRWIIDNQILAAGTSTIPATFHSPEVFGVSAGSAIAANYPVASGSLDCKTTDVALEIKPNGIGIYRGDLTAVVAFDNDPSLFPIPAPTNATELIALGYDRSTSISISTIDIEMSEDFRHDVTDCLQRQIKEVFVEYVSAGWGKGLGLPEPPNWLEVARRLHEATTSAGGFDRPPVDVALRPRLKTRLRRIVRARSAS